jgi:hypothetical protein
MLVTIVISKFYHNMEGKSMPFAMFFFFFLIRVQIKDLDFFINKENHLFHNDYNCVHLNFVYSWWNWEMCFIILVVFKYAGNMLSVWKFFATE